MYSFDLWDNKHNGEPEVWDGERNHGFAYQSGLGLYQANIGGVMWIPGLRVVQHSVFVVDGTC